MSRKYFDEQDRSAFFVEPEECVTCGCCKAEAPRNIGDAHLKASSAFGNKVESSLFPHSEVHTQPNTAAELDAVLSAASICMTECIYYGGTDPKIIKRLKGQGASPHVIVRDKEKRPET